MPFDAEENQVGKQIEDALNDVINETVAKFDSSFVNKWVVAVETINEDGDRGVWTFTSPNAKRWDIQGLLRELENFQIAHQIVEILEDHREG